MCPPAIPGGVERTSQKKRDVANKSELTRKKGAVSKVSGRGNSLLVAPEMKEDRTFLKSKKFQ